METLATKAKERDELYAKKVQTENTLINERRQNAIRREELETKAGELEGRNSLLIRELKETQATLQTSHQQQAQTAIELNTVINENKSLKEQVESLQVLWAQKQCEIEHQEERYKSLQKLNQSLSTTLNQQRKEIQILKSEAEKTRMNHQDIVKALEMEISLLGSAPSHKTL